MPVIMTKKTKIALLVLVPFLVLGLIVYYLLSSVYVEEEQPLVYPESSLVDSLFVAQNTEYVENEAFSQTHEFETIPYKIDICPGDGASVGNGTVYRVTDTIYIFVAEFEDEKGMQNTLIEAFPKAILYNYKPELSSVNCVNADSGYINGFLAHYFVNQFYISDGMVTTLSCMIGYCLDIPDEYEGNNMLVAVGTTDETSESFADCKAVLDALLLTVRYDEVMHQNFEHIKRREAMEKEEGTEQEETVVESETEIATQEVVGTVSIEKAVTIKHENVTELPVKVREPYQTLVVEITWDVPTNNAVLELFYPGNVSFCEPVSQTSTSAKFVMKDVTPSTYTLHVLNYFECGNISMTLSGDLSDSSGAIYAPVQNVDSSLSSDTNTLSGRTQ